MSLQAIQIHLHIYTHIYLYFNLVCAGKSRLEYCFESALRSPSPLPEPPRAGSNVGLAAVVMAYQQSETSSKDTLSNIITTITCNRQGWKNHDLKKMDF